jgi:hypothetical protein
MNLTISENILTMWYDKCEHVLECKSDQRIYFETILKKRSIDAPFLMPHEFLFLVCNCEDRLKHIKKVH